MVSHTRAGWPFQVGLLGCKLLAEPILTPWCRVLLEKLTGLQLVKKFPAFHRTRRFITALTSIHHLSLSWASPIQSIYTHPTSWRSVLILSPPSTPRSPQWSPSLRFPQQDPIHPPLLTYTCHMPSPSHSSWFYHPHNIGWGVQVILLLVMQSPPFPQNQYKWNVCTAQRIFLAPENYILTDIFCDSSQSLQANAEVVPEDEPWPLPSISLSIHYSLVIKPFNDIESELLTTLFNKYFRHCKLSADLILMCCIMILFVCVGHWYRWCYDTEAFVYGTLL